MSQAQADRSARFLYCSWFESWTTEKKLQEEAGRDTGQSMCAELTGVPPSALHQELELLMKSPFTFI